MLQRPALSTPDVVALSRRSRFTVALSLTALITSAPLPSAELQALTWYRPDFPPFFILNGPERNHGFGDVLLQELMGRLPQYQQQLLDAPLSRALEEAQQGTALICTAPLLKTPQRAACLHFSHTFFTVPAPGALIRASERERFAPFMESGKLSLTRLLSTGQFTLGLSSKRSYGSVTDAALAAHREMPYVVAKPRQSYLEFALPALSNNAGLDVALAYQMEAAYWLYLSRSPRPLAFLEILESNPAEKWHIACSGSAQGAVAIAAINQVLAESAFQQTYLQAYTAWWQRLANMLVDPP